MAMETSMTTINDPALVSDATWIWCAKVIGAVAGSAVSLAYMLPDGRREAAMRFAVGLICGMVFGGAAGVTIAEKFALGDVLGRAELMLVGATVSSLAAWTALGVFQRFAERLKSAPIPGLDVSSTEAKDDR